MTDGDTGTAETRTAESTPVVAASRNSWRCVQSGDKSGWLALMADDVVLEDPIGEAVTNPDGTGVRGKAAVADFFDANIGPNRLRITCEEAFPSSSPTEIAYILLRDENPEYIRALSQADAMIIPPRNDDTGVARAAQSGPVFSLDGKGFLHMRYTARTISIEWRKDAATAVAALARILATASPWTLQGRLEPGMGLVCNNVLHDRAGFTDGPNHHRLLYRARYHERITSSQGRIPV